MGYINAARAELDLPPLAVLDDSTLAHDASVARIEDGEAHTLYNHGLVDQDRAQGLTPTGEVQTGGARTGFLAYNAWQGSPEHWAILTDPDNTHIVVAVYCHEGRHAAATGHVFANPDSPADNTPVAQTTQPDGDLANRLP